MDPREVERMLRRLPGPLALIAIVWTAVVWSLWKEILGDEVQAFQAFLATTAIAVITLFVVAC